MSSAQSVPNNDEYTRDTCNKDNKNICDNNQKQTQDDESDEGQDTFDDGDFNNIINHESDIIPSATRHSTDSYSFTSGPTSKRGYQFARQKKGNVVTRGMDFIRRMKWKSNVQQLQSRRLSQPDMDHWDDSFQVQSSWSTQNTPRASIDSSSIPEGLILSSTFTALNNQQQQQNPIMELPPIHEAAASSSHHAYAEQYSRALHTPSRFLPQNQAVITTKVDGTILLFNDIASLCFKIDKSYIGQSILTTLLEDPFRKQITYILNRRKNQRLQPTPVLDNNKGLVLVCGTITPIVKTNGVKSVASLWLKEKNTDNNSDHIYIWIFEEIYETSLSVYVDSECIIRRVLGTMIKIYGYKEADIVGKPVNCLVPALSKEQRDDNLEKIDRLKCFGSQSSQGISFPVILNLNRHVAIGDDDLASFVVKITSLPSIAGRMTVHIGSGLVKSLSPVPAKYLFGRSVDTIVDLVHIKDLIPCLPIILGQLPPHNAVIQYQTCRRLLEKTMQQPIIYVVHRDKSQFEVELQMKRLDDDLIEIWITYDRMRALSKHEKHKHAAVDKRVTDLSLDKVDEEEEIQTNQAQNNKKKPAIRSLRISSFGSVNESRKLFPTGTPTLIMLDDLPPSPSTINGLKKEHPLDDYVILDVLGQGTYGVAKLAYRKSDPSQKKLVIKYIIKSKIIVDSWIRDRQLGSIPMEIHILRTLQKYPHVNCCRLVTSMEDEDHYFVVMELLGDGMDLFDYIELNSNMSEQEIRTIFHQVASAVKHLHEHRIVHRDIKDENIILDQEGTVHLIDFGCATYYKKDRKFDTFTGTLEYCAPEVLQGRPYEGPPQDIWATGILLFTLIYRENPFYNIDDIMEQDLRTPYIMSEGSIDLVRKMLERDVNKRITIDQVLAHPWFQAMV